MQPKPPYTRLYSHPQLPLNYIARDSAGLLWLTNRACTAVVADQPTTAPEIVDHLRWVLPDKTEVARLNRYAAWKWRG